jgi:hypothetical protein
MSAPVDAVASSMMIGLLLLFLLLLSTVAVRPL